MNTSNLITDYIISGVLGVLAFLVPYLMIDISLLKTFTSYEIQNETVLILILTIFVYSLGVMFNQFADTIEESIYKLFGIKIVEEAKAKVKSETKLHHHEALQLIVFTSETAYDYISFRRTMIRIVRSFLLLTTLLPIVHLGWITIFILCDYELVFSTFNLVIILISMILIYSSANILAKLNEGYYSAMINFCKVIEKKK